VVPWRNKLFDALTQANMGDSKEAVGLTIGTTLTKAAALDEVKAGSQIWADEDAAAWKVRGAGYMKDHEKVSSAASILKVYNCDMFKSKKKTTNIMSKIQFPSDLPQITRTETDGGFYVPQLIVVNFMIPLYQHSMMRKVEDGESMQFVMYITIDQDAYEGMRDNRSAAYTVLREWLQAHPTNQADYQNRGRLKAIPEILNVEDINLGMLRPVVVSNSAKPFLTGPKYHDYIKTDTYIEVDVDVHRYTYVARNTLGGMLGEIPKMLLRFGLTVEGREASELPEQLMVGITMKVDQKKALSID
jgi:hypothetical protein